MADILLPDRRPAPVIDNRLSAQPLGLRLPPRMSFGIVNGATLTLEFDQRLYTTRVPATTAFTVQVAGAGRSVSTVSITGSTVTLTLSSAVTAGQAVTVAYTDPADWATSLQSLPGRAVSTFTATTVTNNTAAATGGLSIYGDGSDGVVTIVSNTTLTSDMYYTALTINNGITLIGAGYRIFCTGTATINGVLHNDGASGINNNPTGGAGGLAGTLSGGGKGGDSGTPGQDGGSINPGLGGDGGHGANNGALPGIGGTVTVPTAPNGGAKVIRGLPFGFTLHDLANNAIGPGGGGGGSGGGNGGGGGGGGSLLLAARTIAGVGSIHCNGGNGAAIFGYGGGGGGGLVITISQTTAAITPTATGGLNGGAGSADGVTGRIVAFLNSG